MKKGKLFCRIGKFLLGKKKIPVGDVSNKVVYTSDCEDEDIGKKLKCDKHSMKSKSMFPCNSLYSVIDRLTREFIVGVSGKQKYMIYDGSGHKYYGSQKELKKMADDNIITFDGISKEELKRIIDGVANSKSLFGNVISPNSGAYENAKKLTYMKRLVRRSHTYKDNICKHLKWINDHSSKMFKCTKDREMNDVVKEGKREYYCNLVRLNLFIEKDKHVCDLLAPELGRRSSKFSMDVFNKLIDKVWGVSDEMNNSDAGRLAMDIHTFYMNIGLNREDVIYSSGIDNLVKIAQEKEPVKFKVPGYLMRDLVMVLDRSIDLTSISESSYEVVWFPTKYLFLTGACRYPSKDMLYKKKNIERNIEKKM
jgi:hypothetical protein